MTKLDELAEQISVSFGFKIEEALAEQFEDYNEGGDDDT
jgi:predicted transcriptional regulator